MPNTYGQISKGVNTFLEFYSGYLEGREIKKEQERQKEMRELIKTAIQSGAGQSSFSIDPRGQVTQRYTPGKPTTPTGYASPEQRRMRLGYGLEQPTTQELAPFAPEAIPITEGGPGSFVMPTPGAESIPGVGAEYAPGYEPQRRPELAPAMFEEQFARPMRERIAGAGFEPKITGFERPKEEKLPGLGTEAEKKRSKGQMFIEYVKSQAPKLNVQSYVDKWGGKTAPTQILKTLRKTDADFLNWIEETYGAETAKALFPERYLEKR